MGITLRSLPRAEAFGVRRVATARNIRCGRIVVGAKAYRLRHTRVISFEAAK